MGRVVRSLLKLPAVKRVMLRLANAEAAITRQQAQLAELGGQAQRLSADEANHRALLAEVAQHMPPERRAEVEAAISEQQAQLGRMNERIQRLVADEARHRALLAEVAEHMPPARLAELEATIQGQQAELGTLTATIQTQQAELGPLNDRVQQLSVAQDGQRALLGEVSQHLPPAQRANLEATLHGQQLQLGALNATMHANQIQLTSLNEIVQRLSTEAGSQRDLLSGVPAQVTAPQLAGLEATIADQQAKLGTLSDLVHQSGAARQEQQALAATNAQLAQENRLLKVGHGATFEELAARGKASTGAPYRFDDLLSLREGAPAASAPSVAPLVFVHVPKAGGTTLNNILMKNYRYRLDSYGKDFFPRYYPDEFVSLVQAPVDDDTRRPHFFTGHIDLGQRHLPLHAGAIRRHHDAARAGAAHRLALSVSFDVAAVSLVRGDRQGRAGIVEYFKHFRRDDPAAIRDVRTACRRDRRRCRARRRRGVAQSGGQGFVFRAAGQVRRVRRPAGGAARAAGCVLQALNKTPSNAAKVSRKQTEELKELLAEDIAFYDGAVQLYQRRAKALTFDLAAQVKAFQQEKERLSRSAQSSLPSMERVIFLVGFSSSYVELAG